MLDVDRYSVELPSREFAAGDVLLEQGQSSGKVYVLIEGEVEVLRDGEPIVTVSERGAPFGEISVLLEMAHQASVRARTAVKVLEIERIEDLVRTEPQIILELTQTLARRLVVTNRILAAGRQAFDRLLEPTDQEPDQTRDTKRKLRETWQQLGEEMRGGLGGF